MNAAALQTTPAVRAYLRRATWGLPRERQQEVWDELEEHLLTRAAQLQALGAAPSEALTRALAELGSPAHVSAGMTGVYLMPKLILMASAGALALSAALYALAGGGGSSTMTLPVLTAGLPKPSCVTGTAPSELAVTIVSRSVEDGTTCYIDYSVAKTMYSNFPGSFIDERTLIKLAADLGGRLESTLTDFSNTRREIGNYQDQPGFLDPLD